jgi:creatinine amidohydrolase
VSVLELARMTAPEVAAIDRTTATVVLVVSPIEEHGPHLPLATDLIEAEGVARRLCDRAARDFPGETFLLYPPVPLGADGFEHPATVEIRPTTIRRVVEDIGLSLGRHGFRRIILASHHGGPRHNLALDAAARAVARRSSARVLSVAGRLIVDLYFGGGLAAFYERAGTAKADRPALDVDCHAGAFETAEMLALRPDLVRGGWRALEPVLVPLERLTPGSAAAAGRGLGYFGAPALASGELGERYLDFVVERLYPDFARFLRGERVPGLALRWRVTLRTLAALARARDRMTALLGRRRTSGPGPAMG